MPTMVDVEDEFARAQRLAAETTALLARVRETIADARNRVYAIRLMRELKRRKAHRDS